MPCTLEYNYGNSWGTGLRQAISYSRLAQTKQQLQLQYIRLGGLVRYLTAILILLVLSMARLM